MELNAEKNVQWKNRIFFLIALAAPTMILMIVFYKGGIFPFGDRLLVYHDMQYQYMDFFMWFYDVLHGKESLGYSFTAALGGNTIALFAYYLASPFNLLVYFVKQECIAEFLTLLIGLKLVLCGGTAYVYVRRRFQTKHLYAIFFSVSYSLMGHNILQCSNIMWLDGVIILPLIGLGIYHMIWNKKKGLYFWSLFYGVISNWYIGYMLCLFCILYYIFEYLLHYWEKKESWKEAVRRLIDFAVTSALAVGATCILFLPQALRMSSEGRGFDWTIFKPAYAFSYIAGFRDVFLEPDKLTVTQTNPPIYIGSFVLIFVVLLFLSSKIEAKKKYLIASLLLGLMFAFQYKPLNYVFSALQVPASHAYRYAFIFSFFMIVAAAICLKDEGHAVGKDIRNTTMLIIFSGLLLDYIYQYGAQEKLYLSFVSVILMCVCLWLSQYEKKPLVWGANLLIAVCLLTEFSEKLQMEFEDHTQSVSQYREYNLAMKKSVSELQEKKGTVWRMDKTFTRTTAWCGNNESMAFGYSSVAQYSSTNNIGVSMGMYRLGYTKDTTIVPYEPILPGDSLLGIRYIYSKTPVPECNMMYNTGIKGVSLYENPYALPIGYRMKEGTEDGGYGIDPMDNQEKFFSKIIGEPIKFYTDAEVITGNRDSSQNMTYEIKVCQSGPVYCYFKFAQPYMAVYVNGNYVKKFDWFDNCILYLGDYEEGDTIKVYLTAGENAEVEDYGLRVGTLNMKEFCRVVQIAQEEKLDILCMEKGRLYAQRRSREDEKVLLTIPYEKGWEVKVNGEEVSYLRLEDIFIGIDLPAGENVIEMKYKVPGFMEGALISVLSVLLFYVWEFIRKRGRLIWGQNYRLLFRHLMRKK